MPVDNSLRIAEIREILRTGATSVTNDGHSVTFDHDALRRELRELMAEDDVMRHRKPRVSSINLGNA